ncbi:MAG: zinc ribbon domain-containing protein [Calditrichaeota bacterium]|nr:zinc ribbon domain-containing protein [Candidatus Cloacimonadota bacterium]MCB1047031.1 zinc ribbon domain-containing protein [Calditrichota bacterium]MCB9472943.1 zinc ribbon domain-containing protein [Candidatus Delongbacteria bacterium]
MPTYEYRCSSCGHRLEAFQSMSDAALTSCPTCHTETLERLISGGGGIVFKGSGFYQTDYKSGGSKADKDGSSDSGDSGKSGGGCGSGCACC